MAFEIEQPAVDPGPSAVVEPAKPRLLGYLGPGLMTGASDDDPSGIATYSQAGAQFGYALPWTMLFTYPLMTAVQIVSGRMGRTTGRGLAGNLRQHCPTWLLTAVVLLLLTANAINLGADLGAMADASELVLGGPQALYVLLFAAICISLQVFLQYARYVSVLKWLTLFLFAYVATLFMAKVQWGEALRSFVVPSVHWDRIISRPLSPFWAPPLVHTCSFGRLAGSRGHPDASGPPNSSARRSRAKALNRIHLDTFVGMGFSNLIALAIMITAAATLHANIVTDIRTSAEAAEALRPIAVLLPRRSSRLAYRNRIVVGSSPCGFRCVRGR